MIDVERIDAALRRGRFDLSLGPDLERAYDAWSETAWRRQVAVVLGLIALVSLMGLAADANAGVLHPALALKFGFQLPLLLAGVAASLWLPLTPLRRLLVPVIPVVATVAVTTMLGLRSGPPFTDRFLMIAGLTGLVANLVLPLPLRHAAVLCGLVLVVFAGLPLTLADPAGLATFIDVIGFMGFITVASLEGVRRRERAEKDAFLLKQRDEARMVELSALVMEMTRLIHSDPLTGVGSRRSFDLRFATAWRAAAARGERLGLILIDVDHFKLFNDAAGHPQGDECLRLVAGAIAAGADCPPDAVARYGGEEFALIPQAPGVAVAERVREAVEALRLPHPGLGSGRCVTVSLGVSSASPGHDAITPEGLLAAADDALYRAKRAGRNRVVADAPVRFAG